MMLGSQLEKGCIDGDDTHPEPIFEPSLGTWNSYKDSMVSHPSIRLHLSYIWPAYTPILQIFTIYLYTTGEEIPSININWPLVHLLHAAYVVPCILAYMTGSRSQVTEIPDFAPREKCLLLLKTNLRRRIPYTSYRARRSRFAVHLADPERSACFMLPGYSKTNIATILTTFWVSLVFLCIILVGFRGEPEYRYFEYSGYLYAVFIPLLLPYFYSAGWTSQMNLLAEQIRSRCSGRGVEKGDGFPKVGDREERLAWWIQGLLEEEGDSKSREEERQKILIDPVIEIIRY